MLYLSRKRSDCHEIKSKHIDCSLVPTCDQRIWPWLWPWPCIFKIRYIICCNSAKNGPPRNEKPLYRWNTRHCDHQIWHGPWHWRWIVKVQCGMCYIWAQIVRLPRNEKQAYQWNSRPWIWPSDLTLAMALTLNFQGRIGDFAISKPKMVRSPRNEKQIYRLNHMPLMRPLGLTMDMTLALHFEDKILKKAVSWIGGPIDFEQNGGHSWPWLWPLGEQDEV